MDAQFTSSAPARKASSAWRIRCSPALAKTVTNFAHGMMGNALFGNDESLIVLSQWLEVEQYLEQRPLWPLLGVGRGGQNVIRIGRSNDIQDAAYFDRFALVAELNRDPLRIVKV